MLLIIFLSTHRGRDGVSDFNPGCVMGSPGRASVPAGSHSVGGCCSGAPWPCSPSGRRWSRGCRKILMWGPQTPDLRRQTAETRSGTVFIRAAKFEVEARGSVRDACLTQRMVGFVRRQDEVFRLAWRRRARSFGFGPRGFPPLFAFN